MSPVVITSSDPESHIFLITLWRLSCAASVRRGARPLCMHEDRIYKGSLSFCHLFFTKRSPLSSLTSHCSFSCRTTPWPLSCLLKTSFDDVQTHLGSVFILLPRPSHRCCSWTSIQSRRTGEAHHLHRNSKYQQFSPSHSVRDADLLA